MKGSAGRWRFRCTKCGATREARGVRIGAWSVGKWTLGWCRHCRWFRFLALEQS